MKYLITVVYWFPTRHLLMECNRNVNISDLLRQSNHVPRLPLLMHYTMDVYLSFN